MLGYTQTYGVDFDEVYAPVVSIIALRIVIALGVLGRHIFYKLDISNAFSQADMSHDLNVKGIAGYPIPKRPGYFGYLHVLKSWYGCKQGPRNWHHLLYKIFREFGDSDVHWKVSSHERCCLILMVKGKIVARAATIVDDVFFTVQPAFESYFLSFIEYVKTRVYKPQDVKLEKKPTNFLNLKITYYGNISSDIVKFL